MVCANLGFVRFRQGDLQEATALFSEGLEIARQLEMRFGIAVHLVGLAGIAIEQGQPAQGARCLERQKPSFKNSKHNFSVQIVPIATTSSPLLVPNLTNQPSIQPGLLGRRYRSMKQLARH